MKSQSTRPGTVSPEDLATDGEIRRLLSEAYQLYGAESGSLSHEAGKRAELLQGHAAILEALKGGREARRNIDLALAERRGGTDADTQAADFWQWVRRGISGVDRETRERLDRQNIKQATDVRALSSGTASAGGYLVPQDFADRVDIVRKKTGAVRSVARIVETDTGRDLPAPTVDDTSNLGELLTENSQSSEQDLVFGQITMKSYKYSSKTVVVSMELLQDQAVDLTASALPELLATRISRIENAHFTTGSGVGQPQGVITGATLGKLGASPTTVSVDELVALISSLDPEYRASARFMLRDETLAAIAILKATGNQYLVNVDQGKLLGYPYVVNANMATMASNAKSILFGNFDAGYVVRSVTGMALIRLQEAYATKLQVGFILFVRSDGRTLNPQAVKYFANAA